MNDLKKIDINKKIFKKVIYIIEFLISIFCFKELLEICIIKDTLGYFQLNKIILFGVLSIIIFLVIIYICKKNKGIIENIFLVFAIPMSIGYAILINPLNVPDEGSHIIRAYDISIGNLFVNIDEEGNSYSNIPKELENFSYMRLNEYSNLSSELEKETDYNDQVKIVCAAQGNSPILYVGSALAMFIGRIFSINLFLSIYIGRIINIIIFLIFAYFSIKKIPFAKIMLSIYLCMPMMLQQAGSCSSDAVLNAVLIYYIVHLLYLVFKENPINKKDKIVLYILTALIAMFKYIYILIAGISFILIFNKKENRKQIIKMLSIMILIGSIFAIGWFVFSLNFKSVPPAFEEYYKAANVDSGKQIEFIKNNPIQFIYAFVNEFIIYEGDYIIGAVGEKLGWLDIDVNIGVIMSYIIILVLAALFEESKYQFSMKSKIWILLLIISISAILKIVMYVTWTPVGMNRVCGVQGRYYTPILFLLPMLLVVKENNFKVKNLNEKMMIISSILNVITLLTVVNRYM